MSTSAPSTPAPTQSSSGSSGSSGVKRELVTLPQARVKTIMKSSPDVELVTQESLFLITRAAELFIMYLSKLASRNGREDQTVNYGDLAAVVQRKDSMEFLHDIVPKKITYAQYLKYIEKNPLDDEDDDQDL